MKPGSLQIDQLVLDGVDINAEAFARSLQRELERSLLAGDSSSLPSRATTEINWTPADGHDALARSVAQSVLQAVPRSGNR